MNSLPAIHVHVLFQWCLKIAACSALALTLKRICISSQYSKPFCSIILINHATLTEEYTHIYVRTYRYIYISVTEKFSVRRYETGTKMCPIEKQGAEDEGCEKGCDERHGTRQNQLTFWIWLHWISSQQNWTGNVMIICFLMPFTVLPASSQDRYFTRRGFLAFYHGKKNKEVQKFTKIKTLKITLCFQTF